MSRILRILLVFTFIVSLSSTYVSNALWACGGACGEREGHSSHESRAGEIRGPDAGRPEAEA